MDNQFYNQFDLEQNPAVDPHRKRADYRNPFQVERDRVIFSYPFRRLQSKTQVFQSGEYDFYRTRLTHSIEVAKIGRSICDFLRERSPLLSARFHIDADLTEAICLAHDLGHPPFGHIGERKLNELMSPHGGFEGNGQTLRILSELIYDRPDGSSGMQPTRAFLDGVMKYKALFSELATASDSESPGTYPHNHFLYDDQEKERQIALGCTTLPAELNNPARLNEFKSIECQIMDWADDTAYSLNDIVDGIHARYITTASLEDWMARHSDLSDECQATCNHLLGAIRDGSFERRFSARIGRYIQAVELTERANPLQHTTHRHSFSLVVNESVRRQVDLYKRIAVDLIFQSPQIQQIEFKGGFILKRLFDCLAENYGDPAKAPPLRLLPPVTEQLILREESVAGRFRRLCDVLAALTDGQAIRTYRRLFDPEYGSITELF